MSKIKCLICLHEKEGFCELKKRKKLHVNKRRHCDKFELDESKADILIEKRKNQPESTLRPFWYWLDNSLRKKLFKALESPRVKFKDEIDKEVDYNKFKTTVGSEGEEKDG